MTLNHSFLLIQPTVRCFHRSHPLIMLCFSSEVCYLYIPKSWTSQHLLSTFSLSINHFTHFIFFYNFFFSFLSLGVQGCPPTQWYKKHFSSQVNSWPRASHHQAIQHSPPSSLPKIPSK